MFRNSVEAAELYSAAAEAAMEDMKGKLASKYVNIRVWPLKTSACRGRGRGRLKRAYMCMHVLNVHSSNANVFKVGT